MRSTISTNTWFNKQGQVTPNNPTTVTYGIQQAPYSAVRALLQLVKDEGHRFPLAIIKFTHGRYVDDIFGVDDDSLMTTGFQSTRSPLQGIRIPFF